MSSQMFPGLALVLVLSTVAAEAQAANYGVEARAVTGGTPGAGATYVGPLTGETSAHALHDPAATQWVYNLNQLLYSDAAAESWADIGALVSHVLALAQPVKATNFPAGTTASSMSSFVDRLKVVSPTLPANTPVTLTFHNVMTVDWTGNGLYTGSAACVVQVGASSGTARWSGSYTKEAVFTEAAPIVVKTQVGATLTVSGRLDTFARASFFVPGPLYSGDLELGATCDTPLVAVSGDVQLVSESGVDYAAL